MDLQGTPIGSTNQGMKNTTDPSARDPNFESSGPVAGDSLAAESVRSGGEYSANPNATPSGVSGSKSTFNTTDTSAATTLEPTPDAAEREAKDAWRETADLQGSTGAAGVKYPEALGGQPEFPGSVNPSGYSGGSSGSANVGSDKSSSAGTSGRSVDQQASYSTGSTSGTGVTGGEGKPKGANLQEGGFEGEATQLNYELGSDQDPGRVGLQQIQNANAATAGAKGSRQTDLDNETKYDVLGSDEQA